MGDKQRPSTSKKTNRHLAAGARTLEEVNPGLLNRECQDLPADRWRGGLSLRKWGSNQIREWGRIWEVTSRDQHVLGN